MSCNKDTKKCESKKGNPLPQCCKENLLELLKVIDKVFKENNILYWIDYGTLLGASREGDIIPYDDDGDIGILRQDLEKVLSLSDKFRLLGYHLVSWFYPNFLRLDFSRINELHIDIFIWDIQIMPFIQIWDKGCKEEITTACLYRKNYIQGKDEKKGKNFPVEFLFPLGRIKFNDYYFPCPNNPTEFSKFRYGINWNKKIKER